MSFILSRKAFLINWEMELSSSKIGNFFIFPQKNVYAHILGKWNSYIFQKKLFLYFGNWKFLAPSLKNFRYLSTLEKLKKKTKKKKHSEKISYILGNGTL